MDDRITLAHGSGGRLYRELVENIFLPAFANDTLAELGDSAVCTGAEEVAITTDSFVVNPLFFPGGDIGSLAVSGTVNDLAVSGAVPKYLTCGMVIETGFEIEMLKKIAFSMAKTAKAAGVRIVTGDTKVVEKGCADGIFINTSGVGLFPGGRKPLVQKVLPGDVIICTAPIARHGTAIMAARTGMDFSPVPESDAKPLASLINAALACGAEIHAMRDPTRGGVAATLDEWAGRETDITVEQEKLPVSDNVNGICELLGLDPLFIANEGVILMSTAKSDADKLLRALRNHPDGRNAAIIGFAEKGIGHIYALTDIGTLRRIVLPDGEILPRIC